MKLRAKIDKVLEVALSLLMGFMVLNVLWQVGSRYLLNSPSTFTDEVSRYALIWVGLLGAAYACGKGMHVSIELLEQKLSDKKRRIQRYMIDALVLLFAVLALVIGGMRLMLITFELGQTSSAIQIPLGYIYAVVPLSGFLICYYSISNMLNYTKK
ncbi:C4-dicarboxylate ABC transporter permease [Reichenbachiella sp. 5M10]|uniref:TRAP transporter small permease n=1 Tax=Reichenbachiella sp. 5M10 TaxID=1889772 RepID=UPI000C1612C2|nr:TRAP transporter small permease [Reichenbachiella sp. 5M10]PIB35773.1 C4-dicarboxylate ABC transporter permease [Reichenbachiella sp. 5M10]